MPLTPEYTKARIGYLAMFGGFLMLIDTLWGGLAVTSLYWARVSELALAVAFVLGLPAYLLDFVSSRRIVVFLPALFFFRWASDSYAGPPGTMSRPWHGTELLIASAVLLQLSKLSRNPQAHLPTGGRPQ